MSVEELFLETGTILTTIDITPQLNVIFPGATYNWISSKIFQRRKLNSILFLKLAVHPPSSDS